MSTTVRDNPNQSRYEIWDGDKLAGFSDYQLANAHLTFVRTEIGDAFRGRGLAKDLVREQLEDSRRRGLSVVPECSFVREFIADRGGEYLDLVDSDDRARFSLGT